MSYGVNEVLLASTLGAVVFALLAAQPLVIVGVTAISNACNALKYVTRFPCDIFGFFVAFIYLQKGIQVLTSQWEAGEASAYLSISIALLVLMCAYACSIIGGGSLFQRYVRLFIKDYGTPLTIIFFTGFVHVGRMSSVELQRLPTSKSFFPTQDRGWLIHFWDISVGDVFLAIPFAILLTILFYFDHNVSSLIAQGTEFPLRKPAGFHWDIFLLGFTTGVAGLLGIPFPNGLIPQAPFHTESLCVTVQTVDTDETSNKGKASTSIDHVVEQRASNLAQGLLTLVTMTGPLLVVLHLIPRAVLAGLFFVMGAQALEANGITHKLLFLLRDRALTPASHPLRRVERRTAIWLFVALELLGFGATFAITQTVAAVGFPVFILVLIPVRTHLAPRWFSAAELALLDGPTASPFTMESVGGNYGEQVSLPLGLPPLREDDGGRVNDGGGGGGGGADGALETSLSGHDHHDVSRGDGGTTGDQSDESVAEKGEVRRGASRRRTGPHALSEDNDAID
ncbi:MAG: hypothetical protein M1825_006372 [Sarcosagium campestre]|nr:MAG: hypothetical protein M1825_006372 [Sarcosagium campestre]